MKDKRSTHVVTFGGVRLAVPPDWEDVTDTVSVPNAPFTLAKMTEDVGVLQFSVGLYESGERPHAGVKQLEELLSEFAFQKEFGDPLWRRTHKGNPTSNASAAFRVGKDYVQVWYVSDGSNIALVTYLCSWKERDAQAVERDAIVKGMSFTPK
ncbi:MAG TPA: hypothetical protein VF950_26895 [Planctomycetota bacterium]